MSPEELAARKMFEDFSAQFAEAADKLKADQIEYKKLTDQANGIQRVGLWPKKFSDRELARMKAEDAAEEKKAEEEEKQ